jgi:putative ABC transport system permease protein
MSLWSIVLKSLRQHALSTVVTACSIALAGGLLMSVWSIKEQSRQTFTQITGGFDAVLGARSSKLQLVLNAVFHLEPSPANISWNDFQEIRNHPSVALAVPLAMGDNYRGFRIVGTSTNLFTDVEYADGRAHRVRPGGRLFEPGYKEAVAGSFAARRLGFQPGTRFFPYHGLNFDPSQQHTNDEYLVVGVLEPSNTPADRVIWIPLEGVQTMAGHAAETATDISAALVKLRTPIGGRTLDMLYNRQGNRLTFAWPIGATMANLLDKISWIDRVLALVALLVAVVAAASVLASIYNSMNERRRQIALFRALGAHRRTVFFSVLLEAAAIAALGMVLAYGVYALIMAGAAGVIRAQTGVVLEIWDWNRMMALAPLGLIALSALAGLVPAWKAYRIDVADHLGPAA